MIPTAPTCCPVVSCKNPYNASHKTLSYNAQFPMDNSLIKKNSTFISTTILKFPGHLTCTMTVNSCRHRWSTGTKVLAKAQHEQGCSVPTGQNRPPYLKTQSLTHTHLRSSPTHLHKGQSLWQHE